MALLKGFPPSNRVSSGIYIDVEPSTNPPTRWDNHWVNHKRVRDQAYMDTAYELISNTSNRDFDALDAAVRKYQWTYDLDLHGTQVVYLATMALSELSPKICLKYIEKQKQFQATYDCVIEVWMMLLEEALIAKYGEHGELETV